MAACVFCWDVLVIGQEFSKSYASLMAVRFFLGFFESCVAPGCTLLTGMWFTEVQQLRSTCWWMCQAGLTMIVGGLLSFAFQHVPTTTFQGWQISCLAMGLATVLWSVVMLFLRPDMPVLAWFLCEPLRAAAVENIRLIQTGTASKQLEASHLKELPQDPLEWLILLLKLLLMIQTGALLTFSLTITANIGFSPKQAALMQMPLGISIFCLISMGTYLSAYLRGRHRNLIFMSMLVPAIVGYIILLTSTNKIVQLLTIQLISVGTTVMSMIYLWNSASTGGYTKRVARTCLTMAFFSARGLIGPQLFRADDEPQYIRFKTALLAITCACVPLVLLLTYVQYRENKRRDGLAETVRATWLKEKGDNYEFMSLTDRENIMFRYSYQVTPTSFGYSDEQPTNLKQGSQ